MSTIIKSGLLVALTVTLALPAVAADLTKAYAALRAQDYETAGTMLAGAIKADPRDATARRYMAAAFTGMQQPEQALKSLRVAQAINGVQSCDSRIEFRAHVCYARMCMQRGDVSGARREVQALSAKRPTGKDAADLRALALELEQQSSGGAQPAQAQVNAKG